ncbi:MAG: hypothetical protein ACXV7F_01820 [Methylomonas sp.]
MKALFLGLCLLNLVFFFWEFHEGALQPSIQSQTNLPTILLADELERAQRGAVISKYLDNDAAKLQQLHAERVVDKPIAMLRHTKTVQKNPPKIQPQPQPQPCHKIGPFVDQATASSWLSGNALRGEFFQQEALMPSGYHVYFPATNNPEQSRIQKLMLKAKGITDVWVVPNGELKGALSLGFFKEQARAVAFRNELLQRGVQAEIKERYQSQPAVFVRIKGDQKIPKRLGEGLASANCAKP